ncbi:MAG: hypothetical protein U0414_09730 [Polyangiaceae bacterium]
MRTRTFFLGASVLAILTGCGGPQDPPGTEGSTSGATTSSATATTPPTPTPTVTASAPASAPPVSSSATPTPSSPAGKKLSKEGEICGGIAAFMCEPGLVCSMTKPAYPDQAGKCMKP